MIMKMGFQDTLLMLIAVSSFGESLRRAHPHRPGGGNFKGVIYAIKACRG